MILKGTQIGPECMNFGYVTVTTSLCCCLMSPTKTVGLHFGPLGIAYFKPSSQCFPPWILGRRKNHLNDLHHLTHKSKILQNSSTLPMLFSKVFWNLSLARTVSAGQISWYYKSKQQDIPIDHFRTISAGQISWYWKS